MIMRRFYLTAMLALLLGACGGAEGGVSMSDDDAASSSSTTVLPASMSSTTTTVVDATTTTEPPPTTTTEPRCQPSPVEGTTDDDVGDGRVLPPGCYSTQRWGREVVFEITDPGAVLFEFPYTFGFTRQGTDLDPLDIVLVAEFTGVIPAEQVGSHPPHDEPIGDHMVDVPSDLATWIDSAPQLVVTDSGAYAVEGDRATWWDVEVDASAGDTFSCPYGACVATLVPSPPDEQGTNFVMGDEARFRIVQLSGAGEGLFLWIQAAPERFDGTVALADLIIGTLRVDG